MNPISRILDKLARKLDESPNENFRAFTRKTFQKMDLVTREEFDAKCERMSQNQLRIKDLEQKVGKLEGKTTASDKKT